MRRSRTKLALLTLAAISASLAAVFLRFPAGFAGGARAPAQESAVQPSLPVKISATTRASALRALTNYDGVKPARVSDHFHRWCFDAIQGSFPENSKLQLELALIQGQQSFRKAFPGSPPLFFRSPYGWEVRERTAPHLRDHWQYEPHLDQFLAACAQIGVPLRLPIETDFGQVAVGELLDASRRTFDLSQEVCWTLIAYSTYLPDEPLWTNRFDEQCSYQSMIESILALPLDSGSCGGTHKQLALAWFLTGPSATRLDTNLRRKCENYLRRSGRALEVSQLASGAWGPFWAKERTESQAASGPSLVRGVDLVRITGHQLEWVDQAPPRCRPSSECVKRAIEFLARALDVAEISSMRKDYCAYSHAACVLQRALLRERQEERVR
jgi:hypothetical protein